MSDPEPLTAGCEDWPVDWPCDVTGKDEAQLALAKAAAVTLLSSYGGRSIGVCVFVEKYWPPVAYDCHGPWKDLSSGAWHNGPWHDCCRILLDHQPVLGIIAVSEFGVVLDTDAYERDGAWLRRRGACWSAGFDCTDPPVQVTYSAGFPLPAITGMAVGEVGCEILYAMNGDPCKLPSRAITITRQGVTVQLGSADELAKKRRLGLPIADAWLEQVNPNSIPGMSRVYSPDLARRGR